MGFIKNIKDWITDLLGLVIMGVSSYFYFWHQTIDQTAWITCLCIGFILFWVPDDIILKHLKKNVKKKIDLDE